MELSSDVSEGLQLTSDTTHISDKAYDALITKLFDSLQISANEFDCSDNKELSSCNQGVVKEAYFSLASLALEAAKQDKDSATVSNVLEDNKFSAERIKAFVSQYSEKKDLLRILLSSTGNNPPHIVDVDWRLDYNIKNNHLEKVNQPMYLVTLKTQECGQSDIKDIQFSCTMEQLQDLVAKLKDACKSLERAGQL